MGLHSLLMHNRILYKSLMLLPAFAVQLTCILGVRQRKKKVSDTLLPSLCEFQDRLAQDSGNPRGSPAGHKSWSDL